MAETSHCRSCDAAIVWMKTAAGKNMPVDADSVKHAQLIWKDRKPQFDKRYHISHFSTCPNANQHRRRR